MSGIKRFNHGVCEYPGGIFSEMNKEANGDYVLHSDHEAEVARLRAELQKAAKAALDAVALSCEKEREADALRAEVEGLRSTEARYRWLQKQTPYRFGKIQAACVIDAVDTLYFKADEFDSQVDAAMGASA